jgi:hypothetical protein
MAHIVVARNFIREGMGRGKNHNSQLEVGYLLKQLENIEESDTDKIQSLC